MKRLLPFLLLLGLTFVSHAQTVSHQDACPDVIVDVRTAAEFETGHIPGAINIPLNRIETDVHATQGIRKDSRILVYCRSGQRSAKAHAIFVKRGFQHVLDGGSITTLESRLKRCNAPHR